MRITSNGLIDRLFASLTTARRNSDDALATLADGKRVRTASDDPSAAAAALRLRADLVRNEGQTQAAGLARAELQTLEVAIGEAFNRLTRARSKAVEGGNSTAERDAIAQEIDGIRESLLSLAATRQDDRSLFAGTAVLTDAYDATGAYQGSANATTLVLADGRTVETNFDGRRVFGDGATSVFQELEDLSTALRADDELGIQVAQNVLNTRLDSVRLARSEIGTSLNAIASAEEYLTTQRFRITERLSDLEDASLDETVVQVAQSDAALTAASTALTRSVGRSLFDFFA